LRLDLRSEYPRARELFEQSLAVYRSLDDAWEIVGSVSSLALVVLEAARLYAAASVSRESVGDEMFEAEVRPDPAPSIAHLRSSLGEQAFDEAWEQGQAMSLDQSLAYALAEADARATP
jgi:hypothetical protein